MKNGFFKKLFLAVRAVEEAVLSTSILVIAGLTILNVFTRSLAGVSLAFTEEVSQFLIILVTFVGLSYAAGKGRHIRMTALYDLLPLAGRRWLMIFISATTAVLLLILCGYSIRYAHTLKALGTVSPALQVPFYLVYASAPLGLGLAGLQYLLTTGRNLASKDKVYLSYDETDDYDVAEQPGI